MPELIAGEHPDFPDEVVVQASISPNFEQQKNDVQFVYDEEPESTYIGDPADLYFVFLLDRSYSMEEVGRVEMAIKALKLFLRSLPPYCRFSIISFGSQFEYMTIDN